MTKPMTLEDWAKKLNEIPVDLSFTDTNVIMEDMLKVYGPLKPWPWYKRRAGTLGDWLIRFGVRLGGSYE